MQNRFLQYIRQNQLFEPHHRLLLAVSGGLDSMVMFELFATAGFNIGVAHGNFQLRGTEADADAQFVSEKCRQLAVPFFTTRFETNNYAIANKLSIQMAARELRYAWFSELLKTEEFDFVVTAHHQGDVVETILLNLIHGRGLDGLLGISPKKDKLIRPLLFATRADIERYALDHTIAWREDISNQTDDYERNFVRHNIVPKLKQLNASLEESIQRSISKNKGAWELEQLGIKALESQFVRKQGNRVAIRKDAFDSFHDSAAVLYELIRPFSFSIDQCRQVIKAMNGQSGKSFWSEGYQMVVDREELVITPQVKLPEEVEIAEAQHEAVLGVSRMQIEVSDHVQIDSDVNHAVLDASRLTYPIVWRPWREGDYFFPLGMSNRKKVSDFLIDRKVSLGDKTGVSVLESGGEIVWVVGHRISEHHKITAQTRQVVRFCVIPQFV